MAVLDALAGVCRYRVRKLEINREATLAGRPVHTSTRISRAVLAGVWVLDEPGARPLSHARKVAKLRKWLQTLLQHSLVKGCVRCTSSAAPVDRWWRAS